MSADGRRWSPHVLIALLLVTVVLLTLALHEQSERIAALERQVAAMNAHEAGAPLARIANLEGIANAHTARLQALDRTVYRLRMDQADLEWRTTTNRWDIDQH